MTHSPEGAAALIGRLLLSAIFLSSGYSKRLGVCRCKSWMAAFAAMTRRSTLLHWSLAT